MHIKLPICGFVTLEQAEIYKLCLVSIEFKRMIMMQKNMGALDKIVRISIGVVLMTLAALGIIGFWGWLGAIPVLTGVAGICPLYSLLGINSCRVSK
jgi:hypothetical protein